MKLATVFDCSTIRESGPVVERDIHNAAVTAVRLLANLLEFQNNSCVLNYLYYKNSFGVLTAV